MHLAPTAESEAAATSNEDTSAVASGEENDSQELLNSHLDNERFLRRLAELRSFHSRHGHGSVPNPYPNNPSLGNWAANLRRHDVMRKRAERDGQPYTGPLTPSRRSLLCAVGFDFVSLTERKFLNRVKELEDFRGRFGHCMVPEKWEENAALGAWVSNLRSLYRQRQQSNAFEKTTADHHNVTQKRRRRMRTSNILKKYTFPIKARRRQRFPRFSQLDDERIKLLDDMGFVWCYRDQKWWMMLEWAKIYGVVSRRFRENSYLGHGADSNNNSENYIRNSDALHIDGGRYNHVKILKKDGESFKQYKNNSSSSNTTLLEKYQKFVHSIRHGSLLSDFHLQDEILTQLLKDNRTDAQHSIGNVTQRLKALYQSPCSLDYRIPRNDTLHRPLRIWMVSQRCNNNRLPLQSNVKQSSRSSGMTSQRKHALEEIQFPWSERFPNLMEEVRYRLEKEQQDERQRQKKLKIRQEKEQVERLMISSSLVEVEEEDTNIMALWNEENEDDDHW